MKNKKHIVTGILAHVDAGKTTLSEAIFQNIVSMSMHNIVCFRFRGSGKPLF